MLLGSGKPVAPAVESAKFDPKIEANAPGATRGAKLAASITLLMVVCASATAAETERAIHKTKNLRVNKKLTGLTRAAFTSVTV